jgi:uncharacterized NAD(P)/FAD-binding protein YdhS
MSAFREDVDDFVEWANTEADRSDWPPEWREFEFTESGPAPRRIYPDYLASRLAQAASEALPGVVLIEADGEAVDVEVIGNHVHVVVENLTWPSGDTEAGRVIIEADHVILATGLETRYASFASDVMDHPSFIRHPYSEAGIRRILDLRRDAVVAIVGTLLTAYDSAELLLRRGHSGKIYMISRSGLTLRTYPAHHRHRVLRLPPPRIRVDPREGPEGLVRCLLGEWERACAIVTKQYPEEPAVVVTERVAKAWEPYLPQILEQVPSFDLQALLDRYGSLLATLRVSAVAYTTEIVDAAMIAGQIVHTTGRVDTIRGAEPGRLIVNVARQAARQTIEADLVISNFGRESDYERVESPLWVNLLRNKIACAHRRTGRGVEVDSRGSLLGPAGGPTSTIWAVGSPREGDEIVRNGRTGAFTFNLAAIKNHSVTVAANVLRRLESVYDEETDDVAATLTATLDRETQEAVARSIMLDVRRMAARRRDDRQVLTVQLDEDIYRIQNMTTRTDRAVRSAINAAAIMKLTDLSVTPRDLRSLLGLGRSPMMPGGAT